ncbi:HPr family phosphocarrier protein [bacterium]|nr:HPr family phosphocarrier protein [bacterium]
MTDNNNCECEIKIENKLGLHARPAAMFVELASKFESTILIKKDNTEVNAKSIMGLMMLAAGKGTKLKLIAQGDDCKEALDALSKLIKGKFDEE